MTSEQLVHWYETYGPMVYRRCRTLLANDEQAKDAMQDVFLKVWNRVQDVHDTAPVSYLYRIATTTSLNIIRKQSNRRESSDENILYDIADQYDLEEQTTTRGFLKRFLHGETEETVYMATLHYVDGMTLDEVAHETGYSKSGVRKKLLNLKTKAQSKEMTVK